MTFSVEKISLEKREIANFFAWLTRKNLVIVNNTFRVASEEELREMRKKLVKEEKYDLLDLINEINYTDNRYIGMSAHSTHLSPKEYHNFLSKSFKKKIKISKLLAINSAEKALQIIKTLELQASPNIEITKNIIKEWNAKLKEKAKKTFLKIGSKKIYAPEFFSELISTNEVISDCWEELADSENQKVRDLFRQAVEINLLCSGYSVDFVKAWVKLLEESIIDYCQFKINIKPVSSGYEIDFSRWLDQDMEDMGCGISIQENFLREHPDDTAKLLSESSVITDDEFEKIEHSFMFEKNLLPIGGCSPVFESEEKAKEFIKRVYEKGLVFELLTYDVVKDLITPQENVLAKTQIVLGKNDSKELFNCLSIFFRNMIYFGAKNDPEEVKIYLDKEMEKGVNPSDKNYVFSVKYLKYVKEYSKLSQELSERIVSQLNNRKVITFATPIVVKNLIQLNNLCGDDK